MIQESQIVVFAFPQTDRASGKLRPALVLRACPGRHDDWLICMISSQLRQGLAGIDEVICQTDTDFAQTGLKAASVIRATRLAVVASDVLRGSIGTLAAERLNRIRRRIADWVSEGRAVPHPRDTDLAEQAGAGDA